MLIVEKGPAHHFLIFGEFSVVRFLVSGIPPVDIVAVVMVAEYRVNSTRGLKPCQHRDERFQLLGASVYNVTGEKYQVRIARVDRID